MYQWFDANGEITGETDATFAPTSDGEYRARITDLVNTTCPEIFTDVITVDFVSAPEVDFQIPNTSCVNSVVEFNNTSTVEANLTATYLWDFGDNSTSNLENTSHIYRSTGEFTVRLTVSYAGLDCEDIFTRTITITEGISTEIIADPPTICEGQSTTLSVVGDFETYNWSTGETTETILVDRGDTYEVTVTDINGCDVTVSITIEAQPAPEVTINRRLFCIDRYLRSSTSS